MGCFNYPWTHHIITAHIDTQSTVGECCGEDNMYSHVPVMVFPVSTQHKRPIERTHRVTVVALFTYIVATKT